jgi:hypothetical protein
LNKHKYYKLQSVIKFKKTKNRRRKRNNALFPWIMGPLDA